MNEKKDVKILGDIEKTRQAIKNIFEQRDPESDVHQNAINNYKTNQEKVAARHYAQFGKFNPVTDYELLKSALIVAKKFKVDPLAFESPVDLLNALQRKK